MGGSIDPTCPIGTAKKCEGVFGCFPPGQERCLASFAHCSDSRHGTYGMPLSVGARWSQARKASFAPGEMRPAV